MTEPATGRRHPSAGPGSRSCCASSAGASSWRSSSAPGSRRRGSSATTTSTCPTRSAAWPSTTPTGRVTSTTTTTSGSPTRTTAPTRSPRLYGRESDSPLVVTAVEAESGPPLPTGFDDPEALGLSAPLNELVDDGDVTCLVTRNPTPADEGDDDPAPVAVLCQRTHGDLTVRVLGTQEPDLDEVVDATDEVWEELVVSDRSAQVAAACVTGVLLLGAVAAFGIASTEGDRGRQHGGGPRDRAARHAAAARPGRRGRARRGGRPRGRRSTPTGSPRSRSRRRRARGHLRRSGRDPRLRQRRRRRAGHGDRARPRRPAC